MDKRRLEIPASMFGIVLGLAGLVGDWRAAEQLWAMPRLVGDGLTAVSVLVWVVLLVLYSRKWWIDRPVATAEIRDPVQCCFVALVPISTMLISNALFVWSKQASVILCVIGAAGTLVFGVWRHGGLWHGGRKLEATTPVLYLPTVAGNFVTAIAFATHGWTDAAQLFFGAGVFAWFAIESVVLNRLLLGAEMPLALRPSLGIQLAPAAVGLLAFTTVTPAPFGLPGRMLGGYALFQALLLCRLFPWIARQPFSAGFWTFSFGLTALAAGFMHMAARDGDALAQTSAVAMFVVVNLVIAILLVKSVVGLLSGSLLPQPPVAPANVLPTSEQIYRPGV